MKRSHPFKLLGALLLGLSSSIGTWSSPSAAQSCPLDFASCDNGGCCLSTEKCCPDVADGCCSAFTPYCCGGGVCAASPGECPNLLQKCNDYDLPCGTGCAPAGSACCDTEGHYCPPEQTCTSETTCVLGAESSPALLVVPLVVPGESRPPLRSPVEDPPDATERSCAFMGPPSSSMGLGAAAGWLALAALGWRRRARQA
jgi:hypothetical protein